MMKTNIVLLCLAALFASISSNAQVGDMFPELNTWFKPVYNKFIRDRADAGLFASFTYDVNVYFVPMFTGIKAAAQGKAKKKAIENVDEEILPHILFYKGSLSPYKESLSFEKKDVPYFFVIDKQGKITYATSGRFTERKLKEVEEVVLK